jgi:hypothetical protein
LLQEWNDVRIAVQGLMDTMKKYVAYLEKSCEKSKANQASEIPVSIF